MKLESRGGLLLVGLTIEFRGHTMMVDDLVVDTGAVQSLISIDAVDGLDIAPEPEDECVFMRGIGGRELSLANALTRFGVIPITPPMCCWILDSWRRMRG